MKDEFAVPFFSLSSCMNMLFLWMGRISWWNGHCNFLKSPALEDKTAKASPKDLVGCRIRVWWPMDKKYIFSLYCVYVVNISKHVDVWIYIIHNDILIHTCTCTCTLAYIIHVHVWFWCMYVFIDPCKCSLILVQVLWGCCFVLPHFDKETQGFLLFTWLSCIQGFIFWLFSICHSRLCMMMEMSRIWGWKRNVGNW